MPRKWNTSESEIDRWKKSHAGNKERTRPRGSSLVASELPNRIQKLAGDVTQLRESLRFLMLSIKLADRRRHDDTGVAPPRDASVVLAMREAERALAATVPPKE